MKKIVIFLWYGRAANGMARFGASSSKRYVTLLDSLSSPANSNVVQGMKGLEAPPIKNKVALRASVTGSIFMDSVRVPHGHLLPNGQGLGAPFSCLNSARYVRSRGRRLRSDDENARYGISWGAMGALEDCVEKTLAYALERKQFKRPLASFQLVQQKLVDAQTEIALGLQASLHVGRLKESGRLAPEMVSMVKRNNCGKALQQARIVLDILGGNASSDECVFLLHRFFSVYVGGSAVY